MRNTNELDNKIQDMARRIRDLREITGLSADELAAKTGVSVEEYTECEQGTHDLSFAFIYRCALAFGVDVTDIIEGVAPTLRSYTLTRYGQGQRIEEAHGMRYYNLAASFRDRVSEPLYVISKYSDEAQDQPIPLTTHIGQECDIIISGTLKVQVGNHIEVLHAGDSIYYDSSTPHGMIAVGGADCCFYAIVLDPAGTAVGKKSYIGELYTSEPVKKSASANAHHIYNDYAEIVEDEKGSLKNITFKNTDKFNFAFDVVDRMGRETPDKLALLHIDSDHTERRITFGQVKTESSRCANYFKSLGIRKGDRVMLVLKRHYQFWYAMMGLNKLGAIAIPATNLLKAHDFEYRYKAAGVSAILCTCDGDVADQAGEAIDATGLPIIRIAVGGSKEGWHDFDSEYPLFSGHFERTEDAACGDDLMLMYFTSGTTGYPKIAQHSYKYPLGHLITAKYWQCVDPDGLHLTISDTGWAKAMWGKLYGQWLAEGAVFVYNFDRFNAADILPMFAKYHITTFCAPPTMYRMMIKEDLTKYDMSSVERACIAGEALNPEVFRQFERLTGLKLMEGFGQSESTVIIGNLIGEDHKIGSMGKPVPIYDVHLLDAEGKEVDVGETGEICINIANGLPCGLATGYYMNKEVTDAVWCDGYYHTGDVAWKDEDGFFWYVGRVDDVIKSSGYRIGPFEIESVIMELPYVLECGVTAAPDEVRGQVVKACIVLVKGTEGTDELKKEIQEYVKSHTAPYKYPRIVEFWDELPKTVSGKIQRNLLKG